MTKGNMIRYYRNFSAAHSYIIGFNFKGDMYVMKVNKVMPRWMKLDKASRNAGYSLRMNLLSDEKEKLIKSGKAQRMGGMSLLDGEKYNIGERFEKYVTEQMFGQQWVKDTVGFEVCGDICVNGEEIQIKWQNAQMMSEKRMHRLQERARH